MRTSLVLLRLNLCEVTVTSLPYIRVRRVHTKMSSVYRRIRLDSALLTLWAHFRLPPTSGDR